MGFEEFASSPAFQYGYPLAAALTAAILPNRGARAVNALNTGLGIANAYSQQQKKDEEQKLLGQKLGDFLKSGTVMSAPPSAPASSYEYSMPENRTASLPADMSINAQDAQPPPTPPMSLAPAPTVRKPNFSPQMQKLGDAIIASGKPDALLSIIT